MAFCIFHDEPEQGSGKCPSTNITAYLCSSWGLVSPLPIRRLTTRKLLIASSSWRPLQRYHRPRQCRETIYGTLVSLVLYGYRLSFARKRRARARTTARMQHTAMPLPLPGQREEGEQFQCKQHQPEHLFVALQPRGQKHRRENSRVKA